MTTIANSENDTYQLNVLHTGSPTHIIGTSQKSGLRQITIVNLDTANKVWVGFGNDVSLTEGSPIEPGGRWVRVLNAGAEVWALAETATVRVAIDSMGGHANPNR